MTNLSEQPINLEIEYTHAITSVERDVTSGGKPMWRCQTRQGDTMVVFSNQMGKGIWTVNWANFLLNMNVGDSLRFEAHPIFVSAEKNGRYWNIHDVCPMPPEAKPDIFAAPSIDLFAKYITSLIELWKSEPISIIDTETTGLNTATDEIVSLAAINWQQTRLFNAYGVPYNNLFIQPKHPEKLLQKGKNNKSPFDIHGIHPDRVRACPTFPEVYDRIAKAIQDTHWVCWNAPYDVPLLDSLCIRHGLDLIPRISVTCAMRLTAPVFGEWNDAKGKFAWKKLEDAAVHYGIDPVDAHNAYGDVVMTRAVISHVYDDLKS